MQTRDSKPLYSKARAAFQTTSGMARPGGTLFSRKNTTFSKPMCYLLLASQWVSVPFFVKKKKKKGGYPLSRGISNVHKVPEIRKIYSNQLIILTLFYFPLFRE